MSRVLKSGHEWQALPAALNQGGSYPCLMRWLYASTSAEPSRQEAVLRLHATPTWHQRVRLLWHFTERALAHADEDTRREWAGARWDSVAVLGRPFATAGGSVQRSLLELALNLAEPWPQAYQQVSCG